MDSTEKKRRFAGPIILFCAFFLPGYIYQGAGNPALETADVDILVQSLIIGVPQIALLFYIILTRRYTDPAEAGIVGVRPTDGLRLIAVLVGITVLAIPVALISRAIDATSYLGSFDISISPLSGILLALLCLVTGYREELFFRSYLLTELEPFGRAAAVTVSTLLFALGHLYQGVPACIGTGLLGVFLSAVFLRTRNIHVIALAHGLYNIGTLFLVQIG